MIRQNGVPVTYTAPVTRIRKQRIYRRPDSAPESVQYSVIVDNAQSVASPQLQIRTLANEHKQLVLKQQRDEILRQQAELQQLEHENRIIELQLENARLKRDIRNFEFRTAEAERRPRHHDPDAQYKPRSQSAESDKLKAGYDFKNQKASVEASGNLAWFLGAGLLAIAGSVAYSRTR